MLVKLTDMRSPLVVIMQIAEMYLAKVGFPPGISHFTHGVDEKSSSLTKHTGQTVPF